MTEATSLEPVLDRLLSRGDLTSDDWATLTASPDILSLGMAADDVRRRLHGDRVTFLRVEDVDLTASLELETFPAAAGEIRVRGPVGDERSPDLVKAVVFRAGMTPVAGFSLADVERWANGELERARALLGSLADAGLSALAEVPLDEMVSARPLLDLVREVGLGVSRITVTRPPRDLAGLLRRARDLFRSRPELPAFAPLPRTFPAATPTTGHEDVRTVALARLLVPAGHIQVDWTLYGPKLAQVALTFGADDIDAVSARDEGAEGRRRAPLPEVRRNIEAAGGRPTERNGRFEPRD